ncbi:MAG: hypothetical protein AAGJ18_25495, partial [Bacteroidota bacterium]
FVCPRPKNKIYPPLNPLCRAAAGSETKITYLVYSVLRMYERQCSQSLGTSRLLRHDKRGVDNEALVNFYAIAISIYACAMVSQASLATTFEKKYINFVGMSEKREQRHSIAGRKIKASKTEEKPECNDRNQKTRTIITIQQFIQAIFTSSSFS